MKLVEKYERLSKEELYAMYASIVYEIKEYDKISNKDMLEAIVKEYSIDGFLYYMCTERELKFLKKVISNESIKDTSKYMWEINALSDKLIIDEDTLEIYEEQKPNVSDAIKMFDEKGADPSLPVLMLFIGLIRTYGYILEDEFKDIICDITDIKRKDIEAFYGSPLFHFCCVNYPKDDKIMLVYRDYLEYVDIYLNNYEVGEEITSASIERETLENMFYYGFDISDKSINKMYTMVNKNGYDKLLMKTLEVSRIFDNRYILNNVIEDDKLFEVVSDALDNSLVGIYKGRTREEYNEEFGLGKITDDVRFTSVNQRHASINLTDKKLYDKVYFGLLDYINTKYKLTNVTKIYENRSVLNYDDNCLLENYLFDNLDVIDEFIQDNKYDFNEEELNIAKSLKNAITVQASVVGFTDEYTELLSNGIVYMVKGNGINLSDINYLHPIPSSISARLVMFKDTLLLATILDVAEIETKDADNLLEEYEKATKVYHL